MTAGDILVAKVEGGMGQIQKTYNPLNTLSVRRSPKKQKPKKESVLDLPAFSVSEEPEELASRLYWELYFEETHFNL